MAFDELRVLQFTLSTETMSTIDILKFVKDTLIVIQMYQLLIEFIDNACGCSMAEINFSKLLIKTNLRSSMSQEKLSCLTNFSIEKDMLKNIDADVIIKDFASQNARRNHF
jgi:hypothetical protein